MNSSKNIIAVTALSVILMASLIWLAKSDGQAWIFTASASAASTPDSMVLLPETMTISSPSDREQFIRLAGNPVENQACPSWLDSIQNDLGEVAENCSSNAPARPAVEYGAAFDDGTRALLQVRFYDSSGQRISACLGFAVAKSGWQLGSMRYRRQNNDHQRTRLAAIQ